MSSAPDRRIRVNTATRVASADGEHAVTVVGVSARTALVLSPVALGVAGGTVTLFLPAVAGTEIELLAGIDGSEQIAEGHAVALTFIVVEQAVRSALNDLMALLLGGSGGGQRRHPRIIYDVPIRFGPTLSQGGRLEELSISGASIRVGAALALGARVRLAVPGFASDSSLVFEGAVVNQRPSKEGGLHTGIVFDELPAELRTRLAWLLADLLCR